MVLLYEQHKTILLQILKDVYTTPSVGSRLGFKGGTAAMLIYGLDRYSVDLDFDLLEEDHAEEVFDAVVAIASTYGTIKESRIKRYSLLCVLSHAPGAPQIKIEINRREFGSRFEIQVHLGISMLVMVKEDMFAHKLMAMYERIGKTSRDIYDVYYFFKQGWPINRAIVEARAGVSYKEALERSIEKLEALDTRHILDGLGELLDDAKKDWARAKLKEDTLFFLRVALSAECSGQ